MSDTCETCRFWNFWSTVALVDDRPRALGHCVIQRHLGENVTQTFVQGLTAEDFYCGQFQPAVEPVTEKQDG